MQWDTFVNIAPVIVERLSAKTVIHIPIKIVDSQSRRSKAGCDKGKYTTHALLSNCSSFFFFFFSSREIRFGKERVCRPSPYFLATRASSMTSIYIRCKSPRRAYEHFGISTRATDDVVFTLLVLSASFAYQVKYCKRFCGLFVRVVRVDLATVTGFWPNSIGNLTKK